MTTDLVEKCARAANNAGTPYRVTIDNAEHWQLTGAGTKRYRSFDEAIADAPRIIALAVIDALADGVSEQMAKALLKSLDFGASNPKPDGVHRYYGKFVSADPIADATGAIVAAIRAAKTKPEGANQ